MREVPLPLLRGKNRKAFNRFAKIRKWRYWRSKSTVNKNAKSLLECLTRSLRLLLLTTRKRSMTRKCWNRTGLAGTWLFIFAGKPTENVTVKYLSKRMAYVFYKFAHLFFLICAQKNKHTAHICGGIKTLKLNVRTTLRPAYYGCKNLSHTTSTIRLVKRTGMAANVGFTIRVGCLAPHVRNRSFGSKCSVLKKVLLGLFVASRSHATSPAVIWRPYIDSAPRELRPPCPPSLRLCLSPKKLVTVKLRNKGPRNWIN